MPPTKKDIIAAIQAKKRSYYASTAFSLWRSVSNSIYMAVNQRYQEGEQFTRSGFYLAVLRSQYQDYTETFSQIYREATPVFIHESKKFEGEDLAQRTQWFHNRVWNNMGPRNNGGNSQWIALTKDVPIYGMAVGHTRWLRRAGYREEPVLTSSLTGSEIEWNPQWDIIQNEPDLQRVHPFNWFGDINRGESLEFEGFLDEWTPQRIQSLMDDPEFDSEALGRLAEKLSKGQTYVDSDFYLATEDNRNQTVAKKAPIVFYFGTLNDVPGMEKDPTEYEVICDNNDIYFLKANKIPGRRPIYRVRSSGLNDMPFGDALLAPNLTHQRAMNAMVNLGIDDTIMRIHNGYAAWAQYMQNPNDFMNPTASGVVWMKQDASDKHLPKKIGGERSGAFDDLMSMNQIVHTDNERSGKADQSFGLKQGSETATGRVLLRQADNKKTRAAIIEMTDTGLIPIGKDVLVMAGRNMQEVERRGLSYDGQTFDFTNEDYIAFLNNEYFTVSDSIIKDMQVEAEKRLAFFGHAKEVLMQDPQGLGKILNTLEDVGRNMGIANIERYLNTEQAQPPQVTTTPVSSPEAVPNLSPGGLPGEETLETGELV
jgi:hypothetical protein